MEIGRSIVPWKSRGEGRERELGSGSSVIRCVEARREMDLRETWIFPVFDKGILIDSRGIK